jgi:hypothetical protein
MVPEGFGFLGGSESAEIDEHQVSEGASCVLWPNRVWSRPSWCCGLLLAAVERSLLMNILQCYDTGRYHQVLLSVLQLLVVGGFERSSQNGVCANVGSRWQLIKAGLCSFTYIYTRLVLCCKKYADNQEEGKGTARRNLQCDELAASKTMGLVLGARISNNSRTVYHA